MYIFKFINNGGKVKYFLILGCIIFTVYGQIVAKLRINSGCVPFGNNKIMNIFIMLKDPVILSTYFAAFIASIFWLLAMTKFNFSYAYPLMLVGVILSNSICAGLIIGEQFSLLKILGYLFLVTGILLVLVEK